MYRVATVVAGASQVLHGRNVGQSKGYSFGLILAGRP